MVIHVHNYKNVRYVLMLDASKIHDLNNHFFFLNHISFFFNLLYCKEETLPLYFLIKHTS